MNDPAQSSPLLLQASPSVRVSRSRWGCSTKDLPKKSWVKISQIRTLAVERIGRRLGRVTPEELAQVIEGLGEIIGT